MCIAVEILLLMRGRRVGSPQCMRRMFRSSVARLLNASSPQWTDPVICRPTLWPVTMG